MDLRRFRALYEAGVSISAIARETGHDWRTVKKYLTVQGAVPPVAPSRRGTQPRVVEPFVEVIDAWLRADVELKGTVIYERLVADYGFSGHYQRVKMYVAEARPRMRAELGIEPDALADLHRRFEVIPGAQAQVDWGEEGGVLTHVGIEKVYSFHMVLSYSRDPFCCYTTSMDLGCSGTATVAGSLTSVACRPVLCTTAPKPWFVGMSHRVQRYRCTRKRSPSPATMTSILTC